MRYRTAKKIVDAVSLERNHRKYNQRQFDLAIARYNRTKTQREADKLWNELVSGITAIRRVENAS